MMKTGSVSPGLKFCFSALTRVRFYNAIIVRGCINNTSMSVIENRTNSKRISHI